MNSKYFKFLIFIVTFITVQIALSQKKEQGIEINSKYGFLIAHRPIMNHLPIEHTKSIELNYYFQTNGIQEWHKIYKYPRIGASFLFTSVGNKDVLGNYLGLYSFLEIPFINKDKHKLFWRIGCGIAYGFKVFHPVDNPKNNAISSNFNALINTGFFYQYKFGKNYIKTGIDLTHFSNGSVKLPNLGLNLPYLLVGFGRTINTSPLEKVDPQKTTTYIKKPWSFSIFAITSFKDYYPIGNPRKNVKALSFNFQKVFRHRVGYEVGLDLIYKPTIQNYKPVIYKQKEGFFQLGIYNAYIVSLNKLQMLVGMGLYLRDEYFPDNKLYHRVGLRYRLREKIVFNLSLKSHWAKADYVEYGIGLKL